MFKKRICQLMIVYKVVVSEPLLASSHDVLVKLLVVNSLLSRDWFLLHFQLNLCLFPRDSNLVDIATFLVPWLGFLRIFCFLLISPIRLYFLSFSHSFSFNDGVFLGKSICNLIRFLNLFFNQIVFHEFSRAFKLTVKIIIVTLFSG